MIYTGALCIVHIGNTFKILFSNFRKHNIAECMPQAYFRSNFLSHIGYLETLKLMIYRCRVSP